jgi:transcriptional regulator with XRE-family HTH domain
VAGITSILATMPTTTERIASRVRGLAAENRFTQQRIANVLGMSRTSVTERFSGRVPFTAPELFTLANEFNTDISRFFPEQVAA